VISPAQAWFGTATAKLRASKLGAIGRLVATFDGRDPEALLAASANAVRLHQLLHTLLAQANATSLQLTPRQRNIESSFDEDLTVIEKKHHRQ